jgi:hypothetical protein
MQAVRLFEPPVKRTLLYELKQAEKKNHPSIYTTSHEGAKRDMSDPKETIALPTTGSCSSFVPLGDIHSDLDRVLSSLSFCRDSNWFEESIDRTCVRALDKKGGTLRCEFKRRETFTCTKHRCGGARCLQIKESTRHTRYPRTHQALQTQSSCARRVCWPFCLCRSSRTRLVSRDTIRIPNYRS